MIKVESPEQLRNLIAEAKNNGFRLSNWFFLTTTIQEMTLAGTLFACLREDGLFLLDRQDYGFFRCYYFMPEKGRPNAMSLDLDAVIEFPFQEEMNDVQLLQVKNIEALGFRLGRESGMMRITAEDISAADETLGGPCSQALPEDAPQILSLLRKSLNPLYAFLPDEVKLREKASFGEIFVQKEADRIAGVLVSESNKKTASIKQVAVDSSCRSQGIGKSLLTYYHTYYAGKVSSYQHWVDLHNIPAVNMYLHAGYRFTGRKANEYILLKKE